MIMIIKTVIKERCSVPLGLEIGVINSSIFMRNISLEVDTNYSVELHLDIMHIYFSDML